MIFNLIKRYEKGDPLEAEGLIIRRVPNKEGVPDARVRIEMANKAFISLCNAMHIGRAAQLYKHEQDPVNQFKFNNRVNRQINTLRGLSKNLVREFHEKKLAKIQDES